MFLLLTIAEEKGIDLIKFEKLYNQYKNLMFRVSFDILKDRGLAEDSVQQSFIKILEMFDKLDLEDCNKTRRLFVIICKNISIDLYRKNSKVYNVDIDDFGNLSDKASELDYENIENEVLIAIKMLPKSYYDVIFLKYVQGYNNADISKMLNINEGNVRQRINRGKNKLKEILLEKGAEFND